MRLLQIFVFLFLPLHIFPQTLNFIDDLKSTNGDSLKRIAVISELLLKSVAYQYPDSIAWQKYSDLKVLGVGGNRLNLKFYFCRKKT